MIIIKKLIQIDNKNPDGEIENSGKSIFEIRNQNLCYIHVIGFDPKCFSQFFHGSVLAKSQPLPLV